MSEPGMADVFGLLTQLVVGQQQLGTEVSKLAVGQLQLVTDVSKLAVGQQQLEGEVSKLRTDVSKLSLGHAELRAEVNAMRAALMDRMDRLQNSLTSLQEDGIVTMGTADFAHRKIDHTREEVRIIREQLNALRLQLMRAEARLREIDGEH